MSEAIEATTLSQKRWYLGYIIPLLAIPLIAIGAYSTYYHYFNNFPLVSWELGSDIAMDLISVAMWTIPFKIPIYASKYTFEAGGVGVKRLFRGKIEVPYDRIQKVELHIKAPGRVDAEAIQFARESAESLLTKSAKQMDYTNDDRTIAFMVTSDTVYMISPAKPKTFLKDLKRRVDATHPDGPKMSARVIELTGKGKTVLELG